MINHFVSPCIMQACPNIPLRKLCPNTPPWHLSLSCCRGKQGDTGYEIEQEKDWKQEGKTGMPSAADMVLMPKNVREN